MSEPIGTQFEGKRLNSANDVRVAPDGAIRFTDPTFGILVPSRGSLAEPELDHRRVYRFNSDRAARADRACDNRRRPRLAFAKRWAHSTVLQPDPWSGALCGLAKSIAFSFPCSRLYLFLDGVATGPKPDAVRANRSNLGGCQL